MALNITGFFAISILIQIAIEFENKIPTWYTKIGQHSLEIYCLHWLFIPSMMSIGQWFLEHSTETTKLYNGNHYCPDKFRIHLANRLSDRHLHYKYDFRIENLIS